MEVGQSNVTLEQLNREKANTILPVLIYLIVLMPVGFVGNSLVLYVFKTKKKPSNHRWLILCIAVVDMMACTVCMPAQIVLFNLPYMFYEVALCRLLFLLMPVTIVGPAVMFVLVSIERYMKICRPLMAQLSRATMRWMTLVAAVVTGGVAISCSILNGHSSVDTGVHNVTGVQCWTDDEFKGSLYHAIHYVAYLVLLVSCTVVLVVLYSLIGRRICLHSGFNASFDLRRPSPAYIGPIRKESTDTSSCQPTAGDEEGKEGADGRETVERLRLSTTSLDGNVQREEDSRKRKASMIRHRTVRTTLMLFIVTLVSFLSFVPPIFVRALLSLRPDLAKSIDETGHLVLTMFHRLFLLNNVVNPVIYLIWDNKFRQECKHVFQRLFSICRPGDVPKTENQTT